MLTQFTDDTVIIELVTLMARTYLTAGIMAVGFATMFAGSSGASAAAACLFCATHCSCSSPVARSPLVATMFGSIWSGFVALVGMLGRAVQRELKEQAADFRWLVRRFDR